MRRPRQKWWQAARTPRMAFLIAVLPALACALHVVGGHWVLASLWALIALGYVASGLAMLRWGSPEPDRYPTRWFPFWPPDRDG